MEIFFYCNWINNKDWLIEIKKKFKGWKILTLKDNPDLSKIKIAIVWQLPNQYYKKMKNIKLIFSLGAGVDHILNQNAYNGVTVIRLKNKFMAERMANHVLSQVLIYQLHLKKYYNAQRKSKWINEIEPIDNNKLTIGVLGLGYLGSAVGKKLHQLKYNVIGFKKSKPSKKYPYSIYHKYNDLKKFINKSDIIVNILPLTNQTRKIINKNFLKQMKKNSLIINVGRGSTIQESHLINHLNDNKNFYAFLDVFEKEPLSKKNLLWNMPNVLVTPHVASLTPIRSSVEDMYKNLKQYSKNRKLLTDVNIKKGY